MINLRRNFTLGASDNGKVEIVSNASRAETRRVRALATSRPYSTSAMDYAAAPVAGKSTVSMTQISSNVTRGYLEDIFVEDPRVKRKIFRDLYYHDPISGSAADVYSTLPFSDFHLMGINDKFVLDVYHSSLENLHLRSLLPGISLDYLVLGTFIGSSIFDENKKIYSSIMPQNIENAETQHIPIFGIDPIIDIVIPKEVQKVLKSSDPRIKRLLENVSRSFLNQLANGKLQLQPENTIYLQRSTMTAEEFGTSMYERILPITLIEKALFRGTIDQASRRQRAMLHAVIGGEDEWVPTQEDLQGYKDLILQADMDPTGAILVTRTGVNMQEIRQAQDFWQVDQISDYASQLKYRAFGLSEAILQGETSFSTLDASLSITLDNIRSYREMIQRRLFYEKIFPTLALANDFTKDRYSVTGSHISERTESNGLKTLVASCNDTRRNVVIGSEQEDTSNLLFPKIVWHKQLAPEGDQTYLSILTEMQQMGIPVPLSVIAAAGGLDINEIVNGSKEDIAIRDSLGSISQKIQEINEKYQLAPQGEDGAGGYGAEAKLIEGISGYSVPKRIPMAKRQFRPEDHVGSIDSNGKRRDISAKGRKVLEERVIKKASEVLAERARRDNARKKVIKKKTQKMLHGVYGML